MKQHQSIEQLKRAVLLQKLRQLNNNPKESNFTSHIPSADRSQAVPLSWAQQRLWFLAQLDVNASQAYHIPAGLRLRGQLDKTALLNSLNRIVVRHEMLRTTFVTVDGQPRQRIADASVSTFTLLEHDLRGVDTDIQTQSVMHICETEVSESFNLETGPLIRGRLLQLADDEHVLLITQHHIISDGWSIGRLITEFTALYTAFSQGQDDPLPALTIQYADYTVWQRQWLQGAVLQAQIDFWKQQLTGAPELLELPTDFPRPAQQSYAGASVNFTLSSELTAQLKQFNQRHNVTLFMTLLTAWSVLLSRLSGQNDVVIGTAVANRTHADLENLIGFFVNTLAVRVHLEDQPTTAQLLEQVKATTLAAYSHQDLPFEQLVEIIKPMRSMSHSPLFQTMLTLDNTPAGSELTLPGLTLFTEQLELSTTQFDLSLSVTDAGDLISGNLQYASDLFTSATINRLIAYFQTLLTAMLEDNQQAVNRLPLLSPAETHQLLVDFNATEADYPRHRCIHQLFEQQVEKTPDAIALVYEEQQLSYQQLNQQANRLAHRLIVLGIRPDDRVALCVERSLEMVIGLLGILKAGGAYVPLDPSYPKDRLAYMLADCAPVALLTQQVLRTELAVFDETLKIPVILLDALNDQHDSSDTATFHNPDAVALGLTSQHLAYVIYTSGSTGQPKGVMVEHRGLCNLALAQIKLFGIKQHSRVLQFASFSFDASIWEVIMTLCHGASLFVVNREILLSSTTLIETIQRHQISHITLPASVAMVFPEQAMLSNITLIVAGDVCPLELANRWVNKLHLFNAYGPTETTVCATVYGCNSNQYRSIPIGYPIANSQLYILDSQLNPVPIGVTGELYIGGAGVARGYLNRPDLTAERFIDNPFNEIQGHGSARLYKTGDLGRWLPDGSIEYLGRNDFQVKIRGFRIELGEIEAQLINCAGVNDAVVIAREDVPGDKRLVAYLLVEQGYELSVAEVRSQLASSLAEYMLPSAFVTLDSFPLTPNGKLDRKALPVPDSTAVISRPYEAPHGETETLIADIWKELLHLEQVGRYDQFFELGGHSLLVVTLIERMRQQGLTVTVRTVFNTPVLADMAAMLDGQHVSVATVVVPPNLIPEHCTAITPELLPLVTLSQTEIDTLVDSVSGGVGNIQDIYPLAPLQEGIMFHHLLETQGDAYLLRSVLSFDNRHRLDGFLNALQQVINRHDILRTAIHWQGVSQPVQVVQRHATLPIIERELTGNAQETIYEQLFRQTDPRQLRLNIQQAPLFAAYITFDNQRNEWLLSLLMHHLVCEHVTLEFIIAEIQQILAGHSAELTAPLPYRNFITQALSVSATEHEAYFRDRLGDIDTSTAPFDILNVQGDGSGIAEATLPLSTDLAQHIRRTAKQQGITSAVLFHLAWAQVLAKCTGRNDVVFGTVLMGRLQGSNDADRVLGLFINTLPIRVSLGEHSVQQLITDTYHNLSELLNHEQASLALAQRCSAVEAPMPLFTTLLNYRHSRTQTNPTANNDAVLAEQLVWQGITQHRSEERTNYPITLSVDDFGQDFSLTAQCVEGINPERVVAYLETAISQLVDALSQQPTLPINRLSILPEQEYQQVIHGFNATEADYPQHRCIHQLFEQQVEKTPDAIALVYEEQQLSYQQLNQQANRLAHRLIVLGIRPDDRVTLCVERSLEMVIGLLGILKAGGAYVPLDPSYPKDRLAYMLVDCAPVALLTQQVLRTELAVFDEMVQIPVILLDQPDNQTDEDSFHNPDAVALGLTSQHLAYVIYTSGSTGQPKGVMVEHRGLCNLALAQIKLFGIKQHSRVLQFASFSFDASIWEIVTALSHGGCLCLASKGNLLLGDVLTKTILEYEVTTLLLPSSVVATLPDTLFTKEITLIVGGDVCPPELANKWSEKCNFFNAYGPTEATVFVTSYRCVSDPSTTVPIGYPIANSQLYILDSQLNPVPIGVTGELYIGGAGVARGYLNRPDLTAERFIDNPFNEIQGHGSARLYKTGDLGRWLPDGSIEYLGRNDFQVKIRGFRIELGEIEAQLINCAGVNDAVVIAREDVPGDKRLVAYLLVEQGYELSVAEVRSQLASSLAEYMLPSAFVTLDSFPLTPNGKLDRKALPVPDSTAVISRPYEAPHGETETLIADIWKELLHLEQVGRYDQFFELGGHSLLVVTLIERMRQQGLTVTVRTVFNTPVLADMAAMLDGQHVSVATVVVPPNLIPEHCTAITPELLPLVTLSQTEIDTLVDSVSGGVGNIQDIYPLAPLQEGIMFHHLLETQGDAYLLRSVLSFDNRHRLDGFLNALQQVINRHDILRTAIHWQGVSQPVQVVQRHATLPIIERELTGNAQETIYEQLFRQTDPRQLRLNIQQAPLFAAYITFDNQRNEWLLSLLMHHLVCEHVTLEFIIAEIQQILAGHSAELTAPLPYRNFITQALSVSATEHEAYFRDRLGDIDTSTAPFDILNVQGDGSGIAEATLPLSTDLAQHIRRTAKQQGITSAVLFHLAWAQVLAKCTGRNDVVFGTVLMGRLQGSNDADRVLGLFINTLPIRVSLGEHSVQQLITDTYHNLSELLNHEQASLALAQRCSAVEAPMPLFTTLLNYRHSRTQTNPTANNDAVLAEQLVWQGITQHRSEERTNYPITLSVDDFGQDFSLTAQCVEGINPERVVAYLETAISQLVDALSQQPTLPINRLSILPEQEYQQVIHGFNATEADYPQHRCIHQLFEQQVEKTPDAIALVYEEQQLSYQQLNQQANRLAHRLIVLGIRPDDRVALCVERSLEMIIGLLGILKAGGAYVPLDPSYPKDRLAYMLVDCAPVALLTQQVLRTELAVFDEMVQIPVILLDQPDNQTDEDSFHNPDAVALGLTSQHLAYVIYTSGSTGQPKGVLISHRNTVHSTITRFSSYQEPLQSYLLLSSFAFDSSVTGIFWTLSQGGVLYLPRLESIKDPSQLGDLINKYQISHLLALPSLYELIVERGGSKLSSLKTVIVAGESCPVGLAKRHYQTHPQARLYNEYGPTEGTVWSSHYLISNADQFTQSISIGRAIPNVRIYILDQRYAPVPIGISGEVYIAGEGIARGYLNNPELTATKFIPDPFSHNGERLYRTGDVARFLLTGNIEFLGRLDNQVKIRGFRIELGEIEAQLINCAGVNDAVVIAREDVSGDKRLVAYLLVEQGYELSVAEVRSQLASSLAEYMLPSAFVTLDSFPLTPNGKLDRKALPVPDSTAVISRPYEAPHGETETLIADIWKELLHLEQVGRYDQFFELGGHSLLAVQLVSRVRQSLGMELALRELFAYPALADLAKVVSSAQSSQLPAVAIADRNQPVPLSWAQQRLWFLAQLDVNASQAYHIPAGLRLRGQLDKTALLNSLNRIVVRHEMLRTTFVTVDGQPRQRIADASVSTFTLLEHDLRGVDTDIQTQSVMHICETEVSESFNLETGPLIRGRLLQLADDEHVLLITQHHIISDGWSIGRLITEFTALYTAFSQGQDDPLPALTIQYADYTVWQRQWLQGAVLQAQIDFWKQQLTGAPELLELPTDFPRPAQQSYAGASVNFTLSSELTAQLKQFNQRHNVTLFMTLLTAWSVLLSRLSGQNDVVIGTAVANRTHADLENLIGFFVNTLAVRVHLEDQPTTAQLLEQVKATTLAAYSHQDLPFEQLVEIIKPMRSMSHSPLFQTMLTLDNTPAGSELTLPGLTLFTEQLELSTTQFDLSLSVTDAGDLISGNLQYASDLFTSATINRLIAYFQTLLTAMLEDNQQAVNRLPLLSPAETHQLLVDFNATEADYPRHRCIHQLFEQQVEKTPDAIALVYEEQQLSYQQLNQQANRLAHRLIVLGIRPDDRVALCVERSLEMVIGLLGILKAGGAYVPLDPSYPKDRLAYMLADCAPVALLTQQVLRTELAVFDETLKIPVILLDALNDQHDSSDTATFHNPDAVTLGLTSQHLAYVIYTSGSTGQPKGVMNQHQGVVNRLWWAQNQYHFDNNDRVLQKTPFSFDVSVWEFFLPLITGVQLVIAKPQGHQDPNYLADLIAKAHITTVHFVPSMLQIFLDSADVQACTSLRRVLCSGEALPYSLQLRFHILLPNIELHNLYGPTEAAIDVTSWLCHPEHTLGIVPIGYPIANTQLYILDSQLNPVPIGVTGELYIGGAGVARGYLNRPELTAERFIDNPFKDKVQGQGSARLYKTGDLGRWLPDGSIEYLGRNDFQVKIRGFRIELGEIEAQLINCAGVNDAVVIAREDVSGDKRLVAYLLVEQGYELSVAEVRSQLASSLAEYMLPSAFVTLDSFPLTPNGKLDRKALPVPDSTAVISRPYEAPHGETETLIADIWKELLHLEQVGRYDQFFELGGHSLLTIQLMARLKQTFGIEPALRELFAHPVLKEFASAISAQAKNPYSNLVTIRASGNKPPLFLIHPAGGEIKYALDLAAWIDVEIPVYGLAATGFMPGETPLSSVTEIAASYIECIRHIQPEGAYRIAGWSAGGTIAYEIANQLIGLDKNVSFVGLIDTACKYGNAGDINDIDILLSYLQTVATHDHDVVEQLVALSESNNLDGMINLCRDNGLYPKEIDNESAYRKINVCKSITQNVYDYAIYPMSIPLTLFAANKNSPSDNYLAWQALVGNNIKIIPLEGSHISIVESPYVENLGKSISNELNTINSKSTPLELDYKPLIMIKNGRSDTKPLFCIPGAGASITSFFELSQHLDASLPIYGLQARGLDGQCVPHTDVYSAAANYIKSIRQICPKGPYRLLGHSFGGWIALEIALQLTAIGEDIETIITLDTDVPNFLHDSKKLHTHIEMLLELIKLFELNSDSKLALTETDFLGLDQDEQLELLLARLTEVQIFPPRTKLHTLRGIVRVFETNLNTHYMPSNPYQNKLHLIKVEDVSSFEDDETDYLNSWQQHAPNATLWNVPGNHLTLLSQPHVGKLAELLGVITT